MPHVSHHHPPNDDRARTDVEVVLLGPLKGEQRRIVAQKYGARRRRVLERVRAPLVLARIKVAFGEAQRVVLGQLIGGDLGARERCGGCGRAQARREAFEKLKRPKEDRSVRAMVVEACGRTTWPPARGRGMNIRMRRCADGTRDPRQPTGSPCQINTVHLSSKR